MSASLAPRLTPPARSPRQTVRRSFQGARDRASVRRLLKLGELSAAILLAGVVVERELRELLDGAPRDRLLAAAATLRRRERSDERKQWGRPASHWHPRQLAVAARLLDLISLEHYKAVEDLRRLRNAVAHPSREPALGPEAGVAVVLKVVT